MIYTIRNNCHDDQGMERGGGVGGWVGVVTA